MGNQIAAHRFGARRLCTLLTVAAGDETSGVAYQVDYLARYCERLGAKSIVAEDLYVDRHFLDEFALYYSRNLLPPANSVRRFHLFKRTLSKRQLDKIMDARAARAQHERSREEDRLSADYLGFITVRPVPGAPIGRTVLKRLEDGDERDIWATGDHSVHLGNLRLCVDGIPFQQQDEAVGACATAALWSALYRVTRRDGIRAPTPAEVSEAASRHLLSTGRALPAIGGFTMEQLIEAVRQKGLAPEYVSAASPDTFMAVLHAYLRSGIPVVLELVALEADRKGGPERLVTGTRHAVAAVGFQRGDQADPVLDGVAPFSSAYVKKLYIHDDRLGPYARAFVRPARARQVGGLNGGPPEYIPECLILEIETKRRQRGDRDTPNPQGLERWLVQSALAPVYPKLRLPVRSLITLGAASCEVFEDLVGTRASDLRLDLYYERCGEYVRSLNGRVSRRASAFFQEVSLPRWCAIVRWSLGSEPVADLVYDTTDILRSGEASSGDPSKLLTDARKLLRAVVSLDKKHRQSVLIFGKYFGVPSV